MSRMLHARLDVGALLSALAVLVRPGGRCLLVGNAGPGGVGRGAAVELLGMSHQGVGSEHRR